MKKNFFGLVLIAALVGAAPAHAFDLGVLAGLNFGNNTLSGAAAGNANSVSKSSKAAFEIGAKGNFALLPEVSIEVDAIYATTKSTYNITGNVEATETTKAWEIPVLARYWFIPFASVGVGPYLAFATGDINTGYSDGRADTTTTFDQAGISKTDIGAIASINVAYPIGNSLSIVGDARYLLGLKNLSSWTEAEKLANAGSSDFSIKHRAFEILAGVSYAL